MKEHVIDEIKDKVILSHRAQLEEGSVENSWDLVHQKELCYKNSKIWTGAMAQCITALTTPIKYPASILSTQWHLIINHNSSSRDLKPSSGLCSNQLLDLQAYMQAKNPYA